MHNDPPKWAMYFLKKTCAPPFRDELEGDLLELFDRDITQHGLRKARQKFRWKAFSSLRWYRLPGLKNLQSFPMWNNHFKMAYRHAFKHKSASTVNFLGLLLGITAALYIGLYLKHEWSFDRMHQNGEELYRVLRMDANSNQRDVSTSSLHGKSLQEEFPFISSCRFGNDPVKMGDTDPILVDDFYWSDSTFFEFFTFPLLHGDPATCLDEVNSLVITESLSRQLFGTTASLGKNLKVKIYDGNAEFQMQITGVVAELSPQSHIQFQALGSMANAERLYANLVTNWSFSWLRTYLQIPDDRLLEVEKGLPRLIRKKLGDEAVGRVSMDFQPFYDVYLGSQDIQRSSAKGDRRAVYIFGAIGLLILLISFSNYINLATARAVTRTKEVGIRKVLGTNKIGIITQFVIESVFFTLAAAVSAVLLIHVIAPWLNDFLDLKIQPSILSITDWLVFFGGILTLGLLAGLLPAWSMTKLDFLSKTKSRIQFKNEQGSWTRKLFIGTQYLVTLVMLVATFVIYQQYLYLRNFDLGLNLDQLLHVSVDDRDVQERLLLLKDKMATVPGVQGVAVTGEDLPSEMNNTWSMRWQGLAPDESSNIDVVGVDQDYFELMGVDLTMGRNFSSGFEVDSARAVVLNEEAATKIGLNDIVGQQIEIGERSRRVIGVVKDHHNTTLHAQPGPIAFFIFPPGRRVSPDNLMIKIETSNLSKLLEDLEIVWKQFSSDPLQYNFVDESFAAAYQQEQKFSRLLSSFTLIAILISLIGLFGLISFTTQLKLKEISIRRVLGASEFNLMQLLGKEFLVIFVVALLLAAPLAYYLMQSWLTNYAYHIRLNPLMIMVAAVICLGISVTVIVYHLQRTAQKHPGEILATE